MTANLRAALVIVSLASALALATACVRSTDEWFVEAPFPMRETERLFDVGVVDANGDGRLDVYTTNHHFRQALLLADAKGGYRDVLSEWGLDQSSVFPRAELSFTPPSLEKPGIYFYWLGAQLVVQTHKLAGSGRWSGILRVNDPVQVLRSDNFVVDKTDQQSPTGETVVRFSFTATAEGYLRLRPGGQGLPITLEFDDGIAPTRIFVGQGAVNPAARTFVLAMRDRHGMAWADFNADGILDVFITRGALSGTLRAHSDTIARTIKDELFVSTGKGRFEEVGASLGIAKRGCSGRHVRWLDFDNDGRLDLFVNCYDRGVVAGRYPKQLYRQTVNGKLEDVAEQVGLGLPDQQMASFGWFDVDNDGVLDVLAFQDEGLFLYRNEGGRFRRLPVAERSLGDAVAIGHTLGDDWFYDGKISVADYNRDGYLDAFVASKRGNVLLVNQAGKLGAVEPESVGLPATSITASWVDFDNDGLPDLHLIPQGLYRQTADGRFVRTGLLALDPDQYDAAIVNWFDQDNDGKVDVLMTLHEKSGFKHWWEFSKEPRRYSTWDMRMYRNVGPAASWLQVELKGAPGNLQGIGARVTVVTGEGREAQEVSASEGSFFSQGHYRLYFGLGRTDRPVVIETRWPDGQVTRVDGLGPNRRVVVERTTLH